MIEQLPEVQRLTKREKFVLAAELWDELAAGAPETPDPAITRLLEERYAEYKAGTHPSAAWSGVKRRLGK